MKNKNRLECFRKYSEYKKISKMKKKKTDSENFLDSKFSSLPFLLARGGKTWPKPETAHEKSLAPRVLTIEFVNTISTIRHKERFSENIDFLWWIRFCFKMPVADQTEISLEFQRGVGGGSLVSLVCFGWVCATRTSKFGPRLTWKCVLF